MIPSTARLHDDSWSLIGTDAAAPVAISGQTQVVSNLTPLWSCDLTVMFRTQRSTQWLEFEAWRTARRGRLVSDEILPDRDRVTYGSGVVTFDGGYEFDDGGFDGLPTATLAASVDQYATELTLTMGDEWFLPGRFFWIGDQMLQVISVSGPDITFEPPIRAAASIGTSVSGYGTISMSLSQSSEGIMTRGRRPTSEVTVRMVEVI